MSDTGPDVTPAAGDPGDRPFQPPYGPASPEVPRFGDPRGYDETTRLGFYPTTPPPEPPSWLPPQGPDTIAGPSSGPGRRSRGKAAMAAGLVALVVVATAAGAVGGSAFGSNNSSNNSASATTAASAPTTVGAASQPLSSGGSNSTPKSYAAIAAAVLPVVVSIDVLSGQEGDTGSGIVIESNGYILTNNHVVAAAATSGTVTVHFNDGSNAPAKIVGTDLSSDLAVIKVARTGLQVAHIGSSAGVRVGDPVLAIGSPLGLSGTVTSGIVSALNRPVDTTADQQQEQQQQQGNQFDPFNDNGGASPSTGTGSTASTTQQVTVFGAIQTDAAINPGNSGGALVDAAGNVIGINSAIASLGQTSDSTQSGSIGVGFAIPIDLAKNIAEQLIKTGKATHAQIGVGVNDSTDQSTGITKVIVKSVPAGSPGAKAGLQVGDVITKIGTTVATDSDTLIATVRSHLPGDQITMTITRGGATKTVTVTLGSSSS